MLEMGDLDTLPDKMRALRRWPGARQTQDIWDRLPVFQPAHSVLGVSGFAKSLRTAIEIKVDL
jgi:hypothetical protein